MIGAKDLLWPGMPIKTAAEGGQPPGGVLLRIYFKRDLGIP